MLKVLIIPKKFFIGFVVWIIESIMGYTTKTPRKCDGPHAKGIKNLLFAVQDIRPGEVFSANTNKTSMQVKRQLNRQGHR